MITCYRVDFSYILIYREQSSKPKTEAAKSSAGGGNWFDFGSDFSSQTKTAASSDNWASVFDNQQTSKASSDAWSAEFSSQTSSSGTGSGMIICPTFTFCSYLSSYEKVQTGVSILHPVKKVQKNAQTLFQDPCSRTLILLGQF